MRLNKHYRDGLDTLDARRKFTELWEKSIRRDIPNTYIKIKENCISIIYKDYTKFKHESLIDIPGHDGAYWIRKLQNVCKIETKIGNFSRIDIRCSIEPIRGFKSLVLSTKYNNNLDWEQNFGIIQDYPQNEILKIVKAYKLDTNMQILLSEIVLNIFQHNFVEGVDEIEYLEIKKTKIIVYK